MNWCSIMEPMNSAVSAKASSGRDPVLGDEQASELPERPAAVGVLEQKRRRVGQLHGNVAVPDLDQALSTAQPEAQPAPGPCLRVQAGHGCRSTRSAISWHTLRTSVTQLAGFAAL